MRALALVVVLVLSSMAHADEFGGWKFTPPAGATRQATASIVKFTTVDNDAKTFCQISLYSARAPAGDDVHKEWSDLVERALETRDVSDVVNGKVKDMPIAGRTLTIVHENNPFAAAFYVLQPKGAVSSILLLSSNAASLQKCPIGAFLGSLVLVHAPAAATTAAPTTTTAAPTPAPTPPAAQPAGAPAIAGTWSNGASNYVGGVSTGSIKAQYTLNADGTYEFYRETWGGSTRSDWYFTMLERGTWTLTGDQLSLAPKKTVGTEYNTRTKTTTPVKIPLEPATYTAKTVYFSGLQEWNLALTIAKPTDRDGAFASNASYPSTYLFNNRNNNAFRYKPK